MPKRAEKPAPEPVPEAPAARRVGRPSKYLPVYAAQAKKLCEQGATDHDLCVFFEVDTATLWRWRYAYPEFRSALKVGKKVADDLVERSLFNRAVGFKHHATHFTNYKGDVSETEYVEVLPPDTTACIFWLKNRRREEWRDRIEGELTGKVTFVRDDPTQRPEGYERKGRGKPAKA